MLDLVIEQVSDLQGQRQVIGHVRGQPGRQELPGGDPLQVGAIEVALRGPRQLGVTAQLAREEPLARLEPRRQRVPRVPRQIP